MFDSYLKNEEVLFFVNEIKSNTRLSNKEHNSYSDYGIYMSNELALYLFYDAIIKFSIIIDDGILFDEYLSSVEKLFKKIDNFDDITLGVSKLICKFTMIKLNIKEVCDVGKRNTIIKFIYDKYITNGYLIHGFSSAYLESVKKFGFVPEVYQNFYLDFIRLEKIFEKYDVFNVIDKDFNNKNVYFTDDIVMGCYYSSYAPKFFSNFLLNEEIFGKRVKKDAFLLDNYEYAVSGLKKYLSNSSFSDSDKNDILSIVDRQWNLLHCVKKNISLMFVKRSLIMHQNNILVDDFLNDDDELHNIIDRILNPKKSNICYDKIINAGDFVTIELADYYDVNNCDDNFIESELEDHRLVQSNNDFLNHYGRASVFLLLGSLLISFGVIFTILSILKGM